MTDAEKRTSIWIDRHAPYDMSNDRAQSETELLALSPGL
jgi:hypothetical protein